jgi:hypothetical protein
MMKALSLAVGILVIAQCSAASEGERFVGEWRQVGDSSHTLSISRDGDKYVVRDPNAGVVACEESKGSLSCAGGLAGPNSVAFLESSKHIVWTGSEYYLASLAEEAKARMQGTYSLRLVRKARSTGTPSREGDSLMAHLEVTARTLAFTAGAAKVALDYEVVDISGHDLIVAVTMKDSGAGPYNVPIDVREDSLTIGPNDLKMRLLAPASVWTRK